MQPLPFKSLFIPYRNFKKGIVFVSPRRRRGETRPEFHFFTIITIARVKHTVIIQQFLSRKSGEENKKLP
jgi:hypothetical protein